MKRYHFEHKQMDIDIYINTNNPKAVWNILRLLLGEDTSTPITVMSRCSNFILHDNPEDVE
jgi:hypothetical protein